MSQVLVGVGPARLVVVREVDWMLPKLGRSRPAELVIRRRTRGCRGDPTCRSARAAPDHRAGFCAYDVGVPADGAAALDTAWIPISRSTCLVTTRA